MARGIIIFGPTGAGKTTLGKLVAQKLDYPYYDIDDYIWRKDTEIPFTVMYTRKEKADRLMEAISQQEHFVMAGSMSSFHTAFDPLFDLAVYLTADTAVRAARIHERELAMFGNRVLPGGDLYEAHQRFLRECARYDKDEYDPRTRRQHLEWIGELPCPVLHLKGEDDLAENARIIVSSYWACVHHRSTRKKENLYE